MKKISLFVVIALLSAQIVNAQTVKKVTTLDATLKEQGTQNEASTIAWLQAENPDPTLINMSLSSFNAEFKKALSKLNEKYGTFPAITSEVITDEIVPNLYTANLDPNKLYRLSQYDLKTEKWNSWLRKPKPGETGLFYTGWSEDEPILSVYCWNFGYPNDQQVYTPKAPVIKRSEPEYVYIPGTKKVITYGPDTIETNRSKVEIERNDVKFASYNNKLSYTYENQVKESFREPESCGCPERQQVKYQESCGCRGRYLCEEHFEKTKQKKGFFKTTGGKIITYAAAVAGGYFLRGWIDGRHQNTLGGTVITQGPLDPLPLTSPIYTQGPLWQ